MIKFLILAVVGYVFYRALKSVMIDSRASSSRDAQQGPTDVDDVLVQDPVCKTYIPQRNGIHIRRNGQLIFFCSEECRDRYLEDHPE
jgi:YHS domain-containing protein